MKRLQHFVNLLFSRFTQRLKAVFCEGPNYSKPIAILQVPLHNISGASG